MTGPDWMRCVVVIAIAVVVTLSAAPLPETGAQFVDSDADDGTISAGVLDPILSQIGPATADSVTGRTDADTVTETWADYSHDPNGGDTVSNTLELSIENRTIDAATLDLTVSYAENDTDGGMSGTAASTARTIVVEEFVYNETDLNRTTFVDENDNGRIDLDDLTMAENDANLSSLAGMDAGTARNLTITLSGEAELLDIVGSGDGIDFEIRIRTVNGSVIDDDAARENTIQYA